MNQRREYRPSNPQATLICFAILGIIMVLWTAVILLQGSESAQNTISIVHVIGLIVAGLVFIRWLQRAAWNLDAFGIERKSSSNAVLCWFIPFVNFIWPYLVMKEVWKGSYCPSKGELPRNWTEVSVPLRFPLWWGTWILGGIAGAFTEGNADLIFLVPHLISLLLIISITKGIVENQDRKYVAMRDPTATELEKDRAPIPLPGRTS